jgi:hypothetical protein
LHRTCPLWGESGHRWEIAKCPLLTQSVHGLAAGHCEHAILQIVIAPLVGHASDRSPEPQHLACESLRRTQFIDCQRFKKYAPLINDPSLKSSSLYNRLDEFKIGMGRKDKIHDPVGEQSPACLLKHGRDIFVLRPRTPGSISDIPSPSVTERRVCENHIELRPWRDRQKKIGSYRKYAMLKSVCPSIGCRRNNSIGINIDRHNPRCTCSSSRQGLNARTCPQVSDCFAGKIKPANKFGKIRWSAVVARIINCWADGQLKSRDTGQPSARALQ